MEAPEALMGERTDRRAWPSRQTGDAMQMDIWYDTIVQELSDARLSELLEDAGMTLGPEPPADEEDVPPGDGGAGRGSALVEGPAHATSGAARPTPSRLSPLAWIMHYAWTRPRCSNG